MSFEIFTGIDQMTELKQMFYSLTPNHFAESTIPYDTIALYARTHGIEVKLRRLKSGKTRVRTAPKDIK